MTDCATGVVAGEDLMLRITSNLEHSDTLPTLQRSVWLKCHRPRGRKKALAPPGQGPPLVLRISRVAGYPFLATVKDHESVRTRLERLHVYRLSRPTKYQ